MPGDLPNPGIKPRSSTLQADCLPAEPKGKPKNTRVGSLSLPQQIFPTQESNRGLLHCRQILYQLSYEGTPLEPPEKPYSKLVPKCDVPPKLTEPHQVLYFILSGERGRVQQQIPHCKRNIPKYLDPWTLERYQDGKALIFLRAYFSCLGMHVSCQGIQGIFYFLNIKSH